ncbi:MAG: AAA family ATPase [Deinococcales bacterium]
MIQGLPSNSAETFKRHREECLRSLANLPKLSPRDISERLIELGYKGQDDARQAMSLMAYRHARRLQRLYLDKEARESLPSKQNVLLLGPTGSGKTFLIELLFQHIIKLPTVIVDITSFTETGYIGDSVSTILTRLIMAAEGNPYLAACGIVCLDEFDKLASSSSNARFAGQGTTKDVSGYGVQRELLAMMHGAEVVVPMDYGVSEYGPRLKMSTHDIPFLACGAFAGYREMLKEESLGIGFEPLGKDQHYFENAEAFQKYGFLPELIGRFARIVAFDALDKDTLKTILEENILPRFRNEFAAEGLKLSISKEAMSFIIGRAQQRATGARGLHNELVSAIEEAAYLSFMAKKHSEVIIELDGQNLTSKVQ